MSACRSSAETLFHSLGPAAAEHVDFTIERCFVVALCNIVWAYRRVILWC